MKRKSVLAGLKFVLAAFSLALLGSGCRQKAAATKSADPTQSRLAAIRQAHEPVTLAELNDWYAEPPAADNAAPLYAQAFAALGSQDANSKSFLDKNKKALDLLHEAAARPRCRYPIDLKQGLKAPMPHLPKVKVSSKLLAQEATLNAMQGKMDLAAQSLIDDLRLARSLEQEPTIISQLSRIAAQQTATAALEQLLNRPGCPDTVLSRVQAAFEEAEKANAQGCAPGMIGERCMTIALFQEPPGEVFRELAAMREWLSASFLESYRKSSTNEADFLFCLDQFSNLIAAARSPFPNSLALAGQWPEQMREAQTNGYVIANLMLPKLGQTLENSAARITEMRAGITATAIERYRLANGTALPAALSALVPKYVSTIPTDPFDGQPMHYRTKSPKGYVVYSVGPDRSDDKGTPPKKGSAADVKYDLVFAVER